VEKERRTITEMYKKQISMSEWIENIKHKLTLEFRDEDNRKRDALDKMSSIIGLPYDKQVKMKATDIRDKTKVFTDFIQDHGEELCALRLIPKDPNMPKLRMRGFKAKDVVVKWFPEQKITCEDYQAEFVPHPEHDYWGTIFVVTDSGIFGEIIADGHHNLTQGFYHDNKPHLFTYDFNIWSIEPENNEALEEAKRIMTFIKVHDNDKKDALSKELGSEFANGYIKGYFETVTCEHGLWFVDYNKILGKAYNGFKPIKGEDGLGLASGVVGCPGKASGIARVIADPSDDFKEGEILVCDMTSPDFLPLMQKAAAIVTDRGGMLCHAAIVARELNKPCIVATGDATEKIMTGDRITVDADAGIVRKK
jgi:phosphohistidine swiveling domain-containing protein